MPLVRPVLALVAVLTALASACDSSSGVISGDDIAAEIVESDSPGEPDSRDEPDSPGEPDSPDETGSVGESDVPDGSGLTVDYFASPDLSGPPVRSIHQGPLDFVWEDDEAPDGLDMTDFTARYTGSLTSAESGVHTLRTTNDDGVRLWLNGLTLIDDWNGQGRVENQASVTLEAGRAYDIVVEYAEWAGAGVLQLAWTTPAGVDEIVPLTAFVPEPTPHDTRLRELAQMRGMLFGAIVDTELLGDEDYEQLFADTFNHAQNGGDCLVPHVHNATRPFELDDELLAEKMDPVAAFARRHDMTQQCFHLVWFHEAQWAPWLNDDLTTIEAKQQFIDTRITDLLARYPGPEWSWSVVNEAFDEDGQIRGDLGWYETDTPGEVGSFPNWLAAFGDDTSYIESAFRTARSADPDAPLFYNDYGVEFGGAKWDAVREMVTDFVARDVPIDGVGIQAHLSLTDPEELGQDLTGRFEEIAAIDPTLEVRITELDIGVTNRSGPLAERLEVQAAMYGAVMRACLDAPNCTGVSLWGMFDGLTWRGTDEMPLIFDADFNAKPAWHAIDRELRAARAER